LIKSADVSSKTSQFVTYLDHHGVARGPCSLTPSPLSMTKINHHNCCWLDVTCLLTWMWHACWLGYDEATDLAANLDHRWWLVYDLAADLDHIFPFIIWLFIICWFFSFFHSLHYYLLLADFLDFLNLSYFFLTWLFVIYWSQRIC
jgi:hypothetical protein